MGLTIYYIIYTMVYIMMYINIYIYAVYTVVLPQMVVHITEVPEGNTLPLPITDFN